MKPRILLLIRAAATFCLMAALIYMMRGSLSPMLEALKQTPFFVFPCGIMMFALSVLIVSFRLRILLKAQRVFLSITDIMRLNFVGYFFSSFLPTSAGGDVVKAFYISKKSGKTMQSYTSVFMDRLIGLSTIILIATGALFFVREISESYAMYPLFVLSAGSFLFMAFLFNKKFAKKFFF
ncbi:MAG: lysylphosphatidylglycerol synthase transmembrane domain-containing protein, partial [Candidatus Omnitrophota bacterium]|nr:lysylphosphatidylglycerol synthase transmembrane domain-containing protein [Candidatus Omnitrophota bacterium]